MNFNESEEDRRPERGTERFISSSNEERGGEGRGAVFLLYLHCTDVRWSAEEHMLSGALMISTC